MHKNGKIPLKNETLIPILHSLP